MSGDFGWEGDCVNKGTKLNLISKDQASLQRYNENNSTFSNSSSNIIDNEKSLTSSCQTSLPVVDETWSESILHGGYKLCSSLMLPSVKYFFNFEDDLSLPEIGVNCFNVHELVLSLEDSVGMEIDQVIDEKNNRTSRTPVEMVKRSVNSLFQWESVFQGRRYSKRKLSFLSPLFRGSLVSNDLLSLPSMSSISLNNATSSISKSSWIGEDAIS